LHRLRNSHLEKDLSEKKQYTFKEMISALGQKTTRMMFIYGFASGLPYALALGTLYAWLGDLGFDLATIGILSWIGLAYAFKFLWSPAVSQVKLPILGKLGQRKSWIILCQLLVAICLALISQTDPVTHLGLFAGIAVVMAFASASHDIAVDAWRIESAEDESPLDLLSAVYQLGYRLSSLLGGAGALLLAARSNWPVTYLTMACCMLLALLAGLRAKEPDSTSVAHDNGLRLSGELEPKIRMAALGAVLLGWVWAIWTIGNFMIAVVTNDPNAVTKPDAKIFTQTMAPWIVVATVIWPGMISGFLQYLKRNGRYTLSVNLSRGSSVETFADHIYYSVISPLADLIERLRWAVVLSLLVILTYRLTDLVWGPFAFPFYLNELKYSKDEVALVSKIIGVVMTMVGIAAGAAIMLKIGRMATLTLGAILAALTNLLYVDLANGGQNLDAFLSATYLHKFFATFGFDDRLGRLILAISAENIAVGIASTASVVFASSLVNKSFSTVQYALLSSLTFLVGSLGRGWLGQIKDEQGYASLFYVTTALGGLAIVFCILEWIRQAHAERGQRSEQAQSAEQ
jgi:MFS transporter, PAT family, beta-lactamase induction signal transducer AmpG